jgi:F-type H+-transporting ATPase subunit b
MTMTSLLAAGAAETHHWLLPEAAEIIYGGIASVLVFAALYKLAGPVAKKAFTDRTARIQSEIDQSREARASAETEAGRIRSALGDIAGERARILAEAEAQAEVLVREGRARIEAEMADMEAKAMADIANAGARAGDELRSEISRLTAIAVERAVAATVDERAKQDMIENFITNVGASR